MPKAGTWMRNKETSEVVRVTEDNGAMVRFRNSDVDGEILTAHLERFFDVLDDPTSQDDIEAVLRAGYMAGEVDTGLYNTGLQYVVMDVVDGEIVCTWFQSAQTLENIL